MTGSRPPWREPMVWLITALPLAAVIAGIALVVIAVRSGGSDSVRDPVARTAQMQVGNLDPDERAQRLGMTAVLRVGAGVIEVVPVTGAFDRSAPVRLALSHPTRESADRTEELEPFELGWRTELDVADSHDWTLTVTDEAEQWRLRGRLSKGIRAAHLKPAVGPR